MIRRLFFLVPIVCLLLSACQTQQQSSSRNQPPSNPQAVPAASTPTASSSQSGQRSTPSSASKSRGSDGAERAPRNSPDHGGGEPSGDNRDPGQSASPGDRASGQRVPDQGAAGGDSSAVADGGRRDATGTTGGAGADEAGAGETSAGTDEAGGGAVTAGERMGELGGELDESLAVFDGMILNEREAIRGKAKEESGEGGGQADGPLFEEAELSEPGVTESGGPTTGDETEAEQREATVPAMPGGGKRRSGGPEVAEGRGDGGVPADIGDGSDDDIVARQIREAALAEEDPQLREKLWEEYRKYKNEQGNSE